MPLKAPEFHRLIRTELGPMLTDLGFRRTPGKAGRWMRAEGDQWLVVSFKASWFNDRHSSQRFTVDIWGARRPGARVPTLLTGPERVELLELENRAVAKLPPPDAEVAASLSGEAREVYLNGFRPRTRPYYEGEDVWFQHCDEADLRALIAFIKRVLPTSITRFLGDATTTAPEQVDLA